MPAALAVVVWNWAGFAGVALGVNGPHGVLGANTTAVETDTAPLTPVNPCTVLSSNDQWSLVSLNSGTLSMACSLASRMNRSMPISPMWALRWLDTLISGTRLYCRLM